MSTEITLHDAQVAILHVLLFKPDAPFAELQKASGLTSDHFNFHLKQLLEQKLVAKNDTGAYHLTQKGKEFANRFDTDEKVIERQPKVAVLLIVENEDGKLLAQQRLKQPYFGYWGRPTGKIRWGETLVEAAERELMEETGLTAQIEIRAVYHKMDYKKEADEMLEDKLFFVAHCTHPQGDLIEEFEGGRNAWMTTDEVKAQEKVFGGIDEALDMAHGKGPFISEVRHEYTPEQY